MIPLLARAFIDRIWASMLGNQQIFKPPLRIMTGIAAIDSAISVNAICVPDAEISHALKIASPFIRKIPRLPTVISGQKTYRTFKISSPLQHDHTYIILVDDAPALIEEYATSAVVIELNIYYFSYSEILKKLMPLDLVPASYETIGEIIHLNLADAQLPYKNIIAEVLHLKTGMTVINKVGQIDNIYRFYKFERLAGPNSLKTIHSENGVKIYLDLETVYWCSRLQTERANIVNMVGHNETVCDPFCGAGPQVLPLLKKGATVYANDLNPAAIACLKESLKLNNLACDHIYNCDAEEFLSHLRGKKVDHFVFNLPEYSLDYVRCLSFFSGYRLHCFFFCKAVDDPVETIYLRTGYRVKNDWLRKVRMVSPSKAVYKLEVESRELDALRSEGLINS